MESAVLYVRPARSPGTPRRVGSVDGSFVLDVSDNGRGITEEESRGTRSLGLLGMRERALLIGGDVVIRGSKGQGTNVVVRVPVAH